MYSRWSTQATRVHLYFGRFTSSRIPANTCCLLAKLVKFAHLPVHFIFRHWKRKRKKQEKKKRLPSDTDKAHPQTPRQ